MLFMIIIQEHCACDFDIVSCILVQLRQGNKTISHG